MNTIRNRSLRPLAPVLVAGVLGCGGGLTLPDSSGSGLDLAKVRGDRQTGPVGQPLPEPLVVRIESENDQPLIGHRIAFVLPDGAGGDLEPDTALTNASGEAIVQWVLGPTPGQHEVQARLVVEGGVSPEAVFQASAVPAAPDTLRAVSQLFQPGRRGEPLPEPLVVVVVDRFGNPVAGVEVDWSVAAGHGELSASRTATAADGTAAVAWTLGQSVGVQKASAALGGVTGSPVTFSATVLF